MTTRSIFLSVDTVTVPEVARELATHGFELSGVTAQQGQFRCFTVTDLPVRLRPVKVSRRDLRILRGFANGYTYHQIGALFGVSEGAVKSYSKPLFRRLNVRDRASAVATAYRMGLLDQWEAAA